jgi:serine/threonine-protein kinase
VTDQLPDGIQAALKSQYELIEEIGRGLMARVYLAREAKHDRRVAIKVLNADLATSLGAERFLLEIDIAARLQHPHILPLLDSGVANGVLYYVMPFVEGKSLYERLKAPEPLPASDAVRIAREVASALKHAHDVGVAHLDVKPANILLSNGHAMLADFGIARAICDSCSQSKEIADAIAGTPGYMSPEQAFGTTAPDGRSDVYSLACVFYEMITGAPPFGGTSLTDVVNRQLTPRLPSVRQTRPEVSGTLDRFISQALSPDPSNRPQAIDQFIQVLTANPIAGPVRPTKQPRVGEHPRRRRTLAGLAVAILAVGFFATLGFVSQSEPEQTTRVNPQSVTASQPNLDAAADSTTPKVAVRKNSVC